MEEQQELVDQEELLLLFHSNLKKLKINWKRYDIDFYQRIEKLIEKKLSLYPTIEEEILKLIDVVNEAERISKMELRDAKANKIDIDLGENENIHGIEIPSLLSKSKNKKRKFSKNKKVGKLI